MCIVLIVIVWKDKSSHFLRAASLEFLPDNYAAAERIGSSEQVLQENSASASPLLATLSGRQIREAMTPFKEMEVLKGKSGTKQLNFTSSFKNRVVKQKQEGRINQSKQQEVIWPVETASTTMPSIKEHIPDYTQGGIKDMELENRKGMPNRSYQKNIDNSFQSANVQTDYIEGNRRNIPSRYPYVEMSFLKIRRVIYRGQNQYKDNDIVTNSKEISNSSAESSNIESSLQQKTENVDKRTWRGSRSHCTTICRRCKDMGHLSLGTKCFNSCWSHDTFYTDLCWHMINWSYVCNKLHIQILLVLLYISSLQNNRLKRTHCRIEFWTCLCSPI